jgi:hypothetical protein
MEMWNQDFIDMEVSGHFTFEKDGHDHFQFGLVQGDMGGRLEGSRVEFSWSGNDEMDEASGRGWARIEHGELIGSILFHRGDESEFRAVKAQGF